MYITICLDDESKHLSGGTKASYPALLGRVNWTVQILRSEPFLKL